MTQPASLNDLYRDITPELTGVESEMQEALASDRAVIAEMTDHAYGYGGKRLRPAMVLMVGRTVGTVTQRHLRLGAVVEMIHLATLVHDDIIDGASMRRRRETANRVWSNHDAVLLGDIMFSRAINLLARMGDSRCLTTLTMAVSTLCEGEILQNRHRHNVELTEDEYYEIIEAKTAALYAAGCELAASLAGASAETIEAFRVYGRELGLAFQIIDDCLDLVGEEESMGKSLGTDVKTGKMTLPLIMLRDLPGPAPRALLQKVIGGESSDPADVQAVMAALKEHALVDRALARARQHVNEALAVVRGAVSPESLPPLEAAAAFVLSRTT